MTTERIIATIRKLQALATSSNPHEAAAAAATMQHLMSAHRIGEAQLAADAGAPDELVTDADVLAATGMKTPQTWIVRLAIGVAGANGCRVLIQSSRRGCWAGSVKLYGRTSDLQGATYLFHAMRNEIERLASEWTAANRGQGRGATIAFKYGAAVEIGSRMQAEARAATDALKAAAAAGQQGGALLVINRANIAVQDAISKALGGRKGGSWSGSGVSNRSAFDSGRAAGSTVQLGGRGKLGAAPRQISGVR